MEEPVAVLKCVREYCEACESMYCCSEGSKEKYGEYAGVLNEVLVDCVIEIRFPNSEKSSKDTSLKQRLATAIQGYAEQLKCV